jgi:hypothetical protein
MVKRCDSPSGRIETMRATPSTWPDTMWPPSSSPAFSARSRLRRRPTFHSPSVVLESVSLETSTVKVLPAPAGSTAVAVRQAPSQAIEAPSAIPAAG